MTAAGAGVDSKELALISILSALNFPVAAATTIWAGSMVATDSLGNAVPASAITALKVWGRAEKTIKNTVAEGFGSAGDLRIEVKPGIFEQYNSTGGGAITAAHVGRIVYAADDTTVSLTDGAGTFPPAGKFYGLRDSKACVGLGETSLWDEADDVSIATVKVMRARNVVNGNVADLTAYTVASNAAVNDATLNVANDLVLLVNQTTTTENGLYRVGTVAIGVAPLTREHPMALGYVFLADEFEIAVSVGTIFGHTKWFNSAGGTIGTNTPAFMPESVTVSQVLTSGTATAITGIPLLSATKSNILYTRTATGGTLTNTIGYQTVPAPTPGAMGTASIVPMAVVAAGTVQNLDTSTLLVTVVNR